MRRKQTVSVEPEGPAEIKTRIPVWLYPSTLEVMDWAAETAGYIGNLCRCETRGVRLGWPEQLSQRSYKQENCRCVRSAHRTRCAGRRDPEWRSDRVCVPQCPHTI